MAHHLNTNKQFMIGNGILAFAVIFVVVIFVYMSMRLQRQKEGERYFAETYNVTLVKGFTGDSISILLNDSVLIDQRIDKEPFNFEIKRFAEQSALMIVDKTTDKLSLFELSEKGGNYRFEKDDDEVKLLAQEATAPSVPAYWHSRACLTAQLCLFNGKTVPIRRHNTRFRSPSYTFSVHCVKVAPYRPSCR